MLLVVYGQLPRWLRRRVVRTIAPSYTVGAVCVIEGADGRIVLIRQRYRGRWGLPGGLLSRKEIPEQAAVREVREEVGLHIELLGPPAVLVEPVALRVDLVFRAVPAAGQLVGDLVPTSPEIIAVEWFALGDLPELQEETAAALQAIGTSLDPHG